MQALRGWSSSRGAGCSIQDPVDRASRSARYACRSGTSLAFRSSPRVVSSPDSVATSRSCCITTGSSAPSATQRLVPQDVVAHRAPRNLLDENRLRRGDVAADLRRQLFAHAPHRHARLRALVDGVEPDSAQDTVSMALPCSAGHPGSPGTNMPPRLSGKLRLLSSMA